MQVAEEGQPLTEEAELLRLGLLDLDDDVTGPHLGNVVAEPRASLHVVVVAEPGTPSSPGLHDDAVATLDQQMHRRGRQRHATLTILHLSRQPDLCLLPHHGLPARRPPPFAS
jgi:hypothetical protein